MIALGLFLLGLPLLFKARLHVSDLPLILPAAALMAETNGTYIRDQPLTPSIS